MIYNYSLVWLYFWNLKYVYLRIIRKKALLNIANDQGEGTISEALITVGEVE